MSNEENTNGVENNKVQSTSSTPTENDKNNPSESEVNKEATADVVQDTVDEEATVEVQKTVELGGLNGQFLTNVVKQPMQPVSPATHFGGDINQLAIVSRENTLAKIVAIDKANAQKWANNLPNIYDKFIVATNENAEVFKQFVNTSFTKEKEKIFANDEFVKKIAGNLARIDSEKKRLKITSRKISNICIIVFSVLLVGLCFLSFLFKNQKIIKDFYTMIEDTKKQNVQLNDEKISNLWNIYEQFPTVSLFNSFLNYFGIRLIHEFNNFNVHNLVQSKEDFCTISHVIPFKIGDHIFINYQYVTEKWEDVTTTASVETSYEEVVPKGVGDETKTVTRTETVYAAHIEKTPFRELKSEVYTDFRGNSVDYWNLSSVETKKVKKLKMNRDKDGQLKFDQCFIIGDQNEAEKKLADPIMNSYLPPQTQEMMVKIYQYFHFKNLKLELMGSSFHANSYFVDYNFYTWNSVNQFLNYEAVNIGGTDSINEVENKFNKLLNELIYTPSFLWAIPPASAQMLRNPVNGVNFFLQFGKGYANNPNPIADLETVLTLANVHECITTNRERDAFKDKYFYRFNFYDRIQDVDVYWCDLQSYFTSDVVDIVPVRMENGGVVNVSVPYVKYDEFYETKVFFITKNNTNLLGSFSLADYKENKKLQSALGLNVNSTNLICTPELKVVVANHSISRGNEFNVILDFIKEVNNTPN